MNRSAPRSIWPLVLPAAAILAITMGVRQTTGLFIGPIRHDTGLDVATLSFALALGQFVWGAIQPVFGVVADRWGFQRVLWLGGLVLAAGLAQAALNPGALSLTIALGVLAAAGAGAGSFSILIGAIGARLPDARRSFATGFINAGGSFGQFLFAPLVQALIGIGSWTLAMWGLFASALLTLPLAWLLRGHGLAAAGSASQAGIGLGEQLSCALRDRSYWCLHLGFFSCGLHVAFLVTHLPGEVALCGLPASVSANSLALIGLFNIVGSLAAGWLGGFYRMKYLLAGIYASRALMIALYLMAPSTTATFYVFSAALGLTWLATVPPTAGLVGKLFGPRYLATLFGLTLLSHQTGGFLGAWLGGLALQASGDYHWMWYADMAIALLAAVFNLPIREASPRNPSLATQGG